MAIKHELALYVGGMGARDKNFYNDYTKLLGYEEEAVKIQELYLTGKKTRPQQPCPTNTSTIARWSGRPTT